MWPSIIFLYREQLSGYLGKIGGGHQGFFIVRVKTVIGEYFKTACAHFYVVICINLRQYKISIFVTGDESSNKLYCSAKTNRQTSKQTKLELEEHTPPAPERSQTRRNRHPGDGATFWRQNYQVGAKSYSYRRGAETRILGSNLSGGSIVFTGAL